MTTFGGQTVPPLFGGGGGAPPAGKIFIRSTANFYNSIFDGGLQQAIPNPPTVNIGDDLFVYWNETRGGTFAGPLGGGWAVNMAGSAPVFGDTQLWHRIADGTALDNFTLPADPGTAARFAQMVCIGNDDTPDTIFVSQTGTPAGSTGTDWDVNSISAGFVMNDTCIFCCCMRQLEDTGGIISLSVINQDPSGMQVIGEQTGSVLIGGITISNLWVWWGFLFQQISAALPAFEQGYLPDPLSAGQWTNYQRYRIL